MIITNPTISMTSDFAIGDKVSFRGVNRQETGEIKEFCENGIEILLANGKIVIADLSSLRKRDGK